MRLRNLLSIFVICISFALVSFGQDTYAVAVSADNFETENSSGTYGFLLPETISAEDVQLSAEFYTVYFAVSFNEEESTVSIKLNGLEEKNRQVISRFFISLGLREIMFDKKEYPLQEFYETFLKGANSGK